MPNPNPPRATRRAPLAFLVGTCALACGASTPLEAPPSSPSSRVGLGAAASAALPASSSEADARLSPRPRIPLCGCALCSPVISDDPCETDSDCAPATPCHAERCVARAKAQPPDPGTACTMIQRCDTIDANRCGCLAGRCALTPPPR